MKKWNPDISIRIKSLRNSLGITQEEFADRVGVTRDTVKGWESLSQRRRRNPDRFYIDRLCQVLHTQPEYLLNGDDHYLKLIDKWNQSIDTKQLKEQSLFIDYCESIGCDFEGYSEEDFQRFQTEADQAILNINESIRKDLNNNEES